MSIWESTKRALEEKLWPIYERIVQEVGKEGPKIVKFVYDELKKQGEGTICITEEFWEKEAKPMLRQIAVITKKHASELEKAVEQVGKDLHIDGKAIENFAKEYQNLKISAP